MAKNRFDECVDIVFRFEGGYSDYAEDRGGKTKYGITESTMLLAYKKGIVLYKNIYDLTLEDAKKIYQVEYWDRCRCDEIPAPIDLCVFDASVNCGVSASGKFLQTALNIYLELRGNNTMLKIDGIIGEKTIKVIESISSISHAQFVCSRVNDERIAYYLDVCKRNKSQMAFLSGWIRRVLELEKICLEELR